MSSGAKCICLQSSAPSTYIILDNAPTGCPGSFLCIFAPLSLHTVTTQYSTCLFESRRYKPMASNPIIGKYLIQTPLARCDHLPICDNSFSCVSARINPWAESMWHHWQTDITLTSLLITRGMRVQSPVGGWSHFQEQNLSYCQEEMLALAAHLTPSYGKTVEPSGLLWKWAEERELTLSLPMWVSHHKTLDTPASFLASINCPLCRDNSVWPCFLCIPGRMGGWLEPSRPLGRKSWG